MTCQVTVHDKNITNMHQILIVAVLPFSPYFSLFYLYFYVVCSTLTELGLHRLFKRLCKRPSNAAVGIAVQLIKP